MGTGFSKRKKQAKILQEQFSKMQEKIQETEVTGTAGQGLVAITLSGEHELKQIKINPQCVDPEDVEGLEDLIKAAYKDAFNKLKNQAPKMPNMSDMPNLGSFGL